MSFVTRANADAGEALPQPAHMPLGVPWSANAILAGLAPAELRLLDPIEHVRLAPQRRPLFDPGEPVRHVYFPTSGILSLVQLDERGNAREILPVGSEGMVGATALLGAGIPRHRAVAQTAGTAFRVGLARARLAFDASTGFRARVLSYAQSLIMQLAQKVLCSQSHTVDEQLCLWLLLYSDRLRGTQVEMTHEQIAELLGSRRQGVTEAAHRLMGKRIIAYARGRISVLDRAALERAACSCYGAAFRPTA